MKQANQYKQLKKVINKFRRGILAIISVCSLNRAILLLRYLCYNKIKKEIIPQVLTIGVTYNCQCRCVHCSSNSPELKQSLKEKEMTTWQIKDLIDQAATIGIPRITFFGGEPLLRKDQVLGC